MTILPALLSAHAASLDAADPTLGDAPAAPSNTSGLPGNGFHPNSVTGGFSVDVTSREQVREFYNAVYTSSTGIPMSTTANISSCSPGTNSTAFKESVLRRINWFRAMAGLPAIVTLDNGNNANDQLAAVMMSSNNQLNHMPPATWSCFTTSGSNAASMSNLALGFAGADAITAYIWDFGANNSEVGHRRWILYPQTQIMGTGDVPQTNSSSAANATWVFDANLFGPRPSTRKPYVSWPPAGYVPYQLTYPQWSFALTNANMTNATVTMQSNGVTMAVTLQPVQTGFGENTLVWYPTGLDPTTNTAVFPFAGTDTVYSVTVANIQFGAATVSYSYSVTVFDPAMPGKDYIPVVITGTNQPSTGVANPYTCTSLTNATSYQWRSTLRTNFNFADGAENGLTNFTTNTSAGYSVQDSTAHASGSYSFHLAHPTGADQTMTLNQGFTPQTNTFVFFKSELGYAADGEVAEIQISTNNASSWAAVYSQTGNLSGYPIETAFTNRSVTLTNLAGLPLQLRFNYHYIYGLNYYQPQASTGFGWYIDDIIVTNAEVWTILATNAITSTNFVFTPVQTGKYNLEARGVIDTEFPLDWGVTSVVNAIAGPTVMVLNAPVISGSQVLLNFTVSGTASTFKLLQANQLGTPWATNTAATFTTNVAGSSYRFTTTNGPATRFYRIQTP